MKDLVKIELIKIIKHKDFLLMVSMLRPFQVLCKRLKLI